MAAPVEQKSSASTMAAPLETLAKQALAMLASSEDERQTLMEHADVNRQLIGELLEEFDVSQTGQLEAEEAEQLFTKLARQLLEEAARNGKGAAATHAQGLLDAEDACEAENTALCTTISEMAGNLLKIADSDGDGVVSLEELADLFEGGSLLGAGRGSDDTMAQLVDRPSTLELYELRGCLQMLPRIARHFDSADLLGESWHDNVAGDSHVMMRWESPTHAKDGLSIVGLGRRPTPRATTCPSGASSLMLAWPPRHSRPRPSSSRTRTETTCRLCRSLRARRHSAAPRRGASTRRWSCCPPPSSRSYATSSSRNRC